MAIRAPQETKQATANGDGLKEVALGAPAFFEIDTNGADGLVDVKIVGKLYFFHIGVYPSLSWLVITIYF